MMPAKIDGHVAADFSNNYTAAVIGHCNTGNREIVFVNMRIKHVRDVFWEKTWLAFQW